MSTTPEEDEDTERFASVLGNTLAHAANEVMVLARLEKFFQPKPAHLGATSEAIAELNDNIR